MTSPKARKSWASIKLANVPDTYKQKISIWKERIESNSIKIQRGLSPHLVPIKGKLNLKTDELLKQIHARWHSIPVIRTREKVSFAFGVSCLSGASFAVGHSPEILPELYSVAIVILLLIRWFSYKKVGYQYFFADLCYFTNFLLLLWLWIFPASVYLFLSVFFLAYGPLAWAIVAWRNSLVFHSLDKVTSILIHIGPPIVLYCLVHQSNPNVAVSQYPGMSLSYSQTKLFCFINTTLFYVFWQIMYHLFINIGRREKIAAGRPTSFTWLKRSYSKTRIGKAVNRLPANVQPFAFMLLQYVYAFITMIPSPFFLKYKLACMIFLLTIFSWSIWNGANYYFDIFAGRFEKELIKIKKDIKQWEKDGQLNLEPQSIEMSVASQDILIIR